MRFSEDDAVVAGTILMWGVCIACCVLTAYSPTTRSRLSSIPEHYATFEVYTRERGTTEV